MKKLLLVIAMVATSFVANAQEGQLNLGVNANLPLGDVGKIYDFGFSVEANYLFDVSDKFSVGPSLSYAQFFGKIGDISINTSFLPIAGAARFNVDSFVLGADLGYAVSLEENGEGAFYYRPLVGYKVSDKATLQFSYNGVSSDPGSFGYISLGAAFNVL